MSLPSTMNYTHLTVEERYLIGAMRAQRRTGADIARELGRSASTVSRELRRNRYPTDGHYRAKHAHSMARGRRRRSRQGSAIGYRLWSRVEGLLRQDYSPEQVSGHLRRLGEASLSHETIYRYVWRDKQEGGTLYEHLRGARKRRRKRYGAYDSRGRLAGKRQIVERPAAAEGRARIGDWEIDTVMGGGTACILTLVDRRSGYVLIGHLADRTVEETNRRLEKLISRHPGKFHTITADNGCEFHGYRKVEEKKGVKFYFATPHHSWERGTNENTNGLIRQYLPKGTGMELLSQARCNAIANKLNNRPRKRHQFRTPNDIFHQ